MRWVVAALVALGVAFVAVGGPATAKNFIDGGDIAPGTVGGRQIANGAVSVRKLSRRARRALRGSTGPKGATGATGAQGPVGARGPAGTYDFVDRNGTVVGESFGYYFGTYAQVRLPGGAIVLYDNDPANSNAISLSTTLYYQQAGCAGAAYGPPGLPWDFGIIVASPAAPGSQIYRQVNGAPQSFTAASARTSTGCAPSASRLTNVFEAQPAGTVPAVVKPLHLQAAG